MAFVGRMSCPEKLFENEVFENLSAKIRYQKHQRAEGRQPRLKLEPEPDANCSRTYFKTAADLPSPVDISDRCRAHNVDSSASYCERSSMTEAEISTLRCTSIRSYESETETLMMSTSPSSSLPSPSPESGSISPSETPVFLMDPAQFEQALQQQQQQQQACGSTTSMCSWEEQEPEQNSTSLYKITRSTEMETDIQSSGVPQLELGSEAPSYTYDQHGQRQQVKLIRESNEAYDNWMSGKRKQLQYRQQVLRQQREMQQEKDALRRQLNEQAVREWCARKRMQELLKSSSDANAKSRPRATQKIIPHAQLDKSALSRRPQDWELNKVRQAERRRKMQQREARQKQLEQQQRKEQAARAWQQWIKGVDQRPKPVPLNQGMQTLRGTISELYINPNQWQHIDVNATGH